MKTAVIEKSEVLQRFIFEGMSNYEEDTPLNKTIACLNNSILDCAKVRAGIESCDAEVLKCMLDDVNDMLCYVVDEMQGIEKEFHDTVKAHYEARRKQWNETHKNMKQD